MKSVTLKHSAWFGDKDFMIDFPEAWDVIVYSPKKIAGLTKNQISTKLSNYIRDLSSNKFFKDEKVALLVDDLSRPTPVSHTISVLSSKLVTAGVRKENIFIIIAGGTHDKISEKLLEKKLGNEIINNYKVLAHDMKRQLVYYGKTKRGTPIFVNRILNECSLKIGICGIYPHSPAGFGGGAKIMLGVSGFKTIAHLHYCFKGVNIGGKLENDFRKELEEIAGITGLDSTINIVINDARQVGEIFVGDFIKSHKAAVAFFRNIYCVPNDIENDIVITNTYPFDSTLVFSKKGWWPIKKSPMGSVKVVIGALPLGLGNHGLHPITSNLFEYMYKKFVLYSKLPPKKILTYSLMKLSKMILKNEASRTSPKEFIYFRPEQFTSIDKKFAFDFYGSWKQIKGLLMKRYENRQPKVKIYSCASLQFPRN